MRTRFGFLAGFLLLLGLTLAVGCLEDETKPEQSDKAQASNATKAVATDAGQIVCEQSTHDVGTIKQGEMMTHTFTVKNTGKGVLHIDKVKST